MNCLLSGAIIRIGGAQKRADGVAGAKYSINKNNHIGYKYLGERNEVYVI